MTGPWNEDRVRDLIQRMSSGPDSQSWAAYREAEQVDDPAVIELIGRFLARRLSLREKASLFFLIGHVGAATRDPRAADLLLDEVEKAEGPRLKEEICDALGRLPSFPPRDTVLRLTENARPSVRHAAIRALARSKTEEAEAALLHVLSSSEDAYALTYANASLSEIGTARAVPDLSRLIHYRSDDVKMSAINALRNIGGVELTPIFLEALSDRSSAAKWAAMHALRDHGDARAIYAVQQRLRSILGRTRKIEQAPESEVVLALDYLRRTLPFRATDQLISQIKKKHWVKLFDSEKRWITQQFGV